MRRAFSVSVFPRHQGRILLIRHRRLQEWLPPGGEIEQGETPLEAAHRELEEETGARGVPAAHDGVDGTPPGLLGYEEHEAGAKGTHLNFVFLFDVQSDAVRPNAEFTEYRWIAHFGDTPCARNVLQMGLMALHGGGDPLRATARAWLAAFRAGDLDALLSLYADDAVHISPRIRALHPGTGGELRGKGALRGWWKDALARLPGLRYEERHLTASGDRVFLEYDRLLPGEAATRVAEVFVVRDGRIRESRVYPG